MSGHFWAELKDSFGPIDDEIYRLLRRLDGSDRFSLILWKLPEGKRLDETAPDEDAQEYIQSAGSAEQMTVELRQFANGAPSQYVVGRSVDSPSEDSAVEIPWNDSTTVVNTNEVFDAREAADLFISYYHTGRLPTSYTLRRLNL